MFLLYKIIRKNPAMVSYANNEHLHLHKKQAHL